MLDSEIDVAMKLYSPREATEKAEKIKTKGGQVKWIKNKGKRLVLYTWRHKNKIKGK